MLHGAALKDFAAHLGRTCPLPDPCEATDFRLSRKIWLACSRGIERSRSGNTPPKSAAREQSLVTTVGKEVTFLRVASQFQGPLAQPNMWEWSMILLTIWQPLRDPIGMIRKPFIRNPHVCGSVPVTYSEFPGNGRPGTTAFRGRAPFRPPLYEELCAGSNKARVTNSGDYIQPKFL
jgi:hypothetical protein